MKTRYGKSDRMIEANHQLTEDVMQAVEIDLRQPSMLHGKKGFERIVWAFKNVLNRSVTWLFHDFEEPSNGELHFLHRRGRTD